MMIDLFEGKRKIAFEELPKEIKDKVWAYFKKDFDNDLNGCLDYFTFSFRKVIFKQNIIGLPSTYFDMRGDGNTLLYKGLLQNLEEIIETRAYAVETLICKKIKINETAYAIYELDDNEIVIIEIE